MAASVLVQAFLDFLLPVLSTIFFPSHWLLSYITIIKTKVSGERGMNLFAMTIINPWKEIVQAGEATSCSQVLYTINRVIDCMVFNTVFNSISVILQWPVYQPILSWGSFNQYSTQYSFQVIHLQNIHRMLACCLLIPPSPPKKKKKNFSVWVLIYLFVSLSLTTQSRFLTTRSKELFENIVGKGENAGYQHFVLFPQRFI